MGPAASQNRLEDTDRPKTPDVAVSKPSVSCGAYQGIMKALIGEGALLESMRNSKLTRPAQISLSISAGFSNVMFIIC